MSNRLASTSHRTTSPRDAAPAPTPRAFAASVNGHAVALAVHVTSTPPPGAISHRSPAAA